MRSPHCDNDSIALEFIDTAYDAKILQQERFSAHEISFSQVKSDPVASTTDEECATMGIEMSINRSGYQDTHNLAILCKNPPFFFTLPAIYFGITSKLWQKPSRIQLSQLLTNVDSAWLCGHTSRGKHGHSSLTGSSIPVSSPRTIDIAF